MSDLTDPGLEVRPEDPPPPATSPSRPDAGAVLAEALGYLGAAIVVAGAMLLTAQYWEDMSTTVRLALVGGASAALVTAGFLLPERLGDLGSRIRAVVWLGGTAAAAGFLGLFADEVLDLHGLDVAVLTSTGTFALAAILWLFRPTAIQQVVMMVAAMLGAGMLIADLVSEDGLQGLGVWAVGATWLLLGWGRLLRPHWMAMPFGALAMEIGAMVTSSYDAGLVFALVTVLLVVTLAVLARDLVMLAVGAIGALQALPVAISTWFPGALAGPLALLAGGLLLVLLALRIARRRGRGAEAPPPRPALAQISPATALAASGTVLLTSLAFVLAVALV
jgi:hypothetical protein